LVPYGPIGPPAPVNSGVRPLVYLVAERLVNTDKVNHHAKYHD